ncbi:LacI family DNA-binding transcriptional regulator [Varibaculum vaginae]|uniref:LacI family DNA-binding transcriptional regulator n=1 Tax=Varibaculum vaginae TaxID=2364797 RepID=UPI000F0853CC|nr:LacI family DNA-binding transcriptional regulator [Varibaculum vaginae]
MTQRRRVTLKDIAEEIGLSISSVSLALRDDSRISEPVRARIKEVAHRLGYQVDLSGAMLRSSKPKIIGIVAQLDQELHNKYVANINRYAQAAGYRTITQNASLANGYRQSLEALSQLRINTSVAINPDFSDDELPPNLAPSVVVGQSRVSGADLVRSCNYTGLLELVTHLKSLGHAEITYLDGPESYSSKVRRQALVQAAGEEGVKVHPIPAGNTVDDGFKALQNLLTESWTKQKNHGDSARVGLSGITALACYNDQVAEGAMVALYRAGFSIPRDISVTGFDNSLGASSVAFNLTTVDRGAAKVAEHVTRLAIRRAEKQIDSVEEITVESSLVVRRSTGPAFFLQN